MLASVSSGRRLGLQLRNLDEVLANRKLHATESTMDDKTPSGVVKGDEDRKSRPRVAMISGHIDLAPETFLLHYQAPLDAAIAAGDSFVLSNAGGADTLALGYLLSRSVPPERITIYIHTPPARRQKHGGANETMKRIDRQRTGPEVLDGYRVQGFGVKVVDGWHTERDAIMTRESDYDILWVRSEEDTRMLYGKKYRPGRVSGTEKNRERRELYERVRVEEKAAIRQKDDWPQLPRVEV